MRPKSSPKTLSKRMGRLLSFCRQLLLSCTLSVRQSGVLLLDWLDTFLTVEEQDRLLGWHLGVSL